jgi:hypothetical protein
MERDGIDIGRLERDSGGSAGARHAVEYNRQQLYGIPPEQVDAIWPKIEHLVVNSASRTRGKYAVADIMAAILAGHAQLWVWDSPTALAVLITEIAVYPQNRVCIISTGVGDNADEWWDRSLARIEDFARFAGCTDMLIQCRPGWVRRLLEAGYSKTHIEMEKRL